MQEIQLNDNEVKEVKIGIPGKLYCIHNEMYAFYGPNVYKLGESGDINKRMYSYTTPYLEDVVVKHQTATIRNKQLAENILFCMLAGYRMKSSREFFNCNVEIIKEKMDHVVELFDRHTDEELMNIYFPKKAREIKFKKDIKGFTESMFYADNITKEELVAAPDVSPERIKDK